MNRGLLAAVMAASIASAALGACTSPAPVVSSVPPPTSTAAPPAQIGAFGLGLTGGDANVKPGDDFYRHAGATWLQNNPIPSDRTVWDMSRILGSKAEIAVRDLIAELARQPDASPVERKIVDYYRAFMDEAAIEAAGLAPIAQDLQRMTKAGSKSELLSAAADPTVRARLPIDAYVGLDEKNPDRYIVTVLHAGLGLPDREYYPSDNFAEIRAQYQSHKPAPVLANLTGEQRFFLSWAQIWRTQIREQRLRNHVMTDPIRLQSSASTARYATCRNGTKRSTCSRIRSCSCHRNSV